MTVVSEVDKKEKLRFNKLAKHPMQTWEWGEFRGSNRVRITRIGEYYKGRLVSGYQISWHKIPGINKFIGYCPRSDIPSKKVLLFVARIARKMNAITVKWEPNVLKDTGKVQMEKLRRSFLFIAGKPLFTEHTFWLDLTKKEGDLLAEMKSKTRYNIRVAKRRGVKIIEDSSLSGFDDYWRLTEETTTRQSFYAHNRDYHKKMWQVMSKSGIGHLFKAVYKDNVLVTWIVFVLNGVIYYPYGASSSRYREVMASNLMMWEMIRFGKKLGCKKFDLWGSLGPNPDKNHPWYGFHRFKEGYGASLVEMVGSWDLVVSPVWYYLYRFGEFFRWRILRFLKKIR